MKQRHTATSTEEQKGKRPVAPETEEDREARSITTAIHIPETTWKLLRAVAFHRAQDQGGRASVSKLIAELVELHRTELEQEAQANR